VGGFDPVLLPADPAAPGLTTEEVAALLDSTARIVAAELTALGDLAGWHPAPGEWCANECVGHILEADRRGFAGRIRRILAAPPGVEPEEPGWDQAAVAAERNDCQQDPATLVAEIAVSRIDAVELVRSLQPADLDRAAIHAVVGRVTVRGILNEWVHHDRNHVRQLLLNAQARAWPVMGNNRKFVLDGV
jgi:hypothetical protein